MSVTIHQPEIEALIQQRLDTGAFQDVEDVLLHALKSAPIPAIDKQSQQNFADFLLASPLRGSGLELEGTGDFQLPIKL